MIHPTTIPQQFHRLRALTESGPRPPVPPGGVYAWCRPVLDRLVALVLLVLTSPVIGLAMLLVKWTSRGPTLYSQIRLGLHGAPFAIFKIRTMVHNCEAGTGPRWSSPGDPRITPVGRFLRVTHLDELPQLWNVLRGDMALVGPRPERPEFIPVLQRSIPRYRDRLVIKPGLTGLAQVNLPADTDLASVRRKLAHDLYYVEHAGFWLDVRLVLCTAGHVVGIPFRVLARLFCIPDDARVNA
jgi:lipopolysaccharide/colanic/teichoic acid biosynthesis glycosyltransferase